MTPATERLGIVAANSGVNPSLASEAIAAARGASAVPI
jgi:hypothetical protein